MYKDIYCLPFILMLRHCFFYIVIINITFVKYILYVIAFCIYINLKGDGPLGAFTYTIITNLRNFLNAHTLESYPSILAIVEESVESLGADATNIEKDAERLRLHTYCFDRINIAKDYFNNHFLATNINREPRSGDNNFGHLYGMFEAFALTDPEHMRKKMIEFNDDNELLINYIRPLLQLLINMNRIQQGLYLSLMGHIGQYAAIARQFSYGDGNVRFHQKLIMYLSFWREQRMYLHYWFEFVKIVILHHPNSCGSERLFSLLKHVITTEREDALDDYICAAVYSTYRMRHDDERIGGEM
jgi:hypothetical protein